MHYRIFNLNIRNTDQFTNIVKNFEPVLSFRPLIDVSTNDWTIAKQCRLWSDAASRGVWSESTLLAQACLTRKGL